jgi:3-hydroxyisobutyrate dehydrogenase-like beta-hydroxyacid dehydrogenase
MCVCARLDSFLRLHPQSIAGDAGQVAKICNNLILGISMTAVSEAMNLGVKMGMDPKTLADIVNT